MATFIRYSTNAVMTVQMRSKTMMEGKVNNHERKLVNAPNTLTTVITKFTEQIRTPCKYLKKTSLNHNTYNMYKSHELYVCSRSINNDTKTRNYLAAKAFYQRVSKE